MKPKRFKDRIIKSITNYDEGSIIWLTVETVNYIRAVIKSMNDLMAARRIEKDFENE